MELVDTSRDNAASAAVTAPPVARLDPTGKSEETETAQERRNVLKNIILISIACMVHFTAYYGARNLQSSIHKSAVGVYSLCAIYGSLAISSMFLPVAIIRRIGCKRAIAFSFISYMPFIMAHFHPSYSTMIPTAVCVGIGAAPLWCGVNTYLSVAAEVYSELTGIAWDVITVRFFGIFFMLYQYSQVFGNLISSLMIHMTVAQTNDTDVNVPYKCGINYCPDTTDNNINLELPSEQQVYIVAGIYLAFMACAVPIVLFGVDSLERYGEGVREGSGLGLKGFNLLNAVIKLFTEWNQLLLIPITVFTGIGLGFMSAEYTKAYVACAYGIHNIGYVMLCYGVSTSLSAAGTGWLVKKSGRLSIASAAFVLQVCILFTMYFWKLGPEEYMILFALAAFWGLCDGVWQVIVNALCGIVFPYREEAAYSNFRLWQSLGFLISQIFCNRVCTKIQVGVIIAFLLCGMAGYVIVELEEIKKRKQHELVVFLEKNRPSTVEKSGPLYQRALTDDDRRFIATEKRRIYINVVFLSIAFMVQFTAFQGTGNLQSTINPELGTTSMAIIYGGLIFFSMFLPPIVVRRLGCKWSMTLSMFLYIPYILSQTYFEPLTMIPTALMLAFGASVLWVSQSYYLSVLAENYSELTGITSDVLTTRFFGIFFMIFQLCQVWGNLISSAVFATSSSENETDIDVRETCGANFCPYMGHEANNTNMARPTDSKIFTVVAAYACCMILAVLIVVLAVDSLARYGEKERMQLPGRRLSAAQLLSSIFAMWVDLKFLLVVPVILWTGINQAFVAADYTKNFVACAMGVHYIGYVMICYGVCNSVTSVCAGWLVKLTGRVPVLSAAFILQVTLLICMTTWKPRPEKIYVFFVFSGLWGACEGVWLAQINSLCGILFIGREEPAYSNYRLWQSLGFVIAFSYSNYLCTITKIYIVMGILAAGMLGYLLAEYGELQRKRTIITNTYSVYRHFKI